MNKIFNLIKNKLIVSCQASGKEPLNTPETLTKIAKACINGGAAAIRAEGIDNIQLMKEQLKVPVIGLIKSKFPDNFVKITGRFHDVEELMKIGTDIIAIDGTFRKREKMTGPEFIQKVKREFGCLIMADISTVKEALACADYGADCISTTLSGYTPDTLYLNNDKPDLILLKKLTARLEIPVIAEGRYNSLHYTRLAIKSGAWSVVVGTAITRPQIITKWFAESLKNT